MSGVKLASLQRENTKNSNDFRFQIFMKPLLIFVSHNVFPNIITKHTGPLNRILLKQEETLGGKHERRFRVNRGNCSGVHLPMATGLIRAGRTQQPPMHFFVSVRSANFV